VVDHLYRAILTHSNLDGLRRSRISDRIVDEVAHRVKHEIGVARCPDGAVDAARLDAFALVEGRRNENARNCDHDLAEIATFPRVNHHRVQPGDPEVLLRSSALSRGYRQVRGWAFRKAADCIARLLRHGEPAS
jgi:hypothetical protein